MCAGQFPSNKRKEKKWKEEDADLDANLFEMPNPYKRRLAELEPRRDESKGPLSTHSTNTPSHGLH